jgi:histidinol-phosphate aminotransferase
MGLVRESVEHMSGYVPGEQPKGGNIIKLNTNENPYPPSPKVAEALQTIDVESLRKYPDPTASKMRERIAELHGCKAENVFVGNGSDEILALCTRAFVENDGSVGYFDPSYSLYPVLSDIRDVKKVTVELDADFGWVTPAADLCSLFFLTNPNAPTSMLFPKASIDSFCAEFQGVVLLDEAYVDFSSVNCMDLALKYKNVLVMRTLSKSFSLAGLRVGYVVGDADLIEALMKIKDSYNLDAVAQTLALAALNDMDYMRSNAAKIIAARTMLADSLQDMEFFVCPSESNFLWVKPPESVAASELFDKLKQSGILVRYFSVDGISEYIRITVGTDDEVAALLRAVRHIIESGE